MTDDYDGGMTLREEVDADLDDDLVERLHTMIAAKMDFDIFRMRLVHILNRFERYEMGKPQVTRKERSKQINKLSNTAQKFLEAVEELHPSVTNSIDMRCGTLKFLKAAQDMYVLDPDFPEISEDGFISSAKDELCDLLKACEHELEGMEATKGTKRKSSVPGLNQLISDAYTLYETETGYPERSAIYRSPTATDDYEGLFFTMMKTLLDGYAGKRFATGAALGKRIERILKEF
ncbi:MAG: hypothetical protein OQK00_02100 [Rhodobacteraceae bacterium]|nr:hypothetical protein [Paracoccaceae bacterium]MCW9043412.1 hypothetical protein [Pseudopelagicola sp.]